jgi:hypothetical protein
MDEQTDSQMELSILGGLLISEDVNYIGSVICCTKMFWWLR